jgi:hypothetical protein
MIIAAIIVVLITPMLWMAFIPLNIRINTSSGLYEISQTGSVTMSLHPGETPFFKLNVLGFRIETLRKKPTKLKASEEKRTRAKAKCKAKSLNAWLLLFNGIRRSFYCRRFVCSIDFDDAVLNAQLLPVGYFLSRGPVILNVNFEKKYLLDVWIQVRIYRMLWGFIRFYLTK